jgi:hypothetical protein
MAGDIQGALQNAAGISDQKQKIDHYKLLLSSIMCNNNVQHAKAFIDHSKFWFVYSTVGSDLKPCCCHVNVPLLYFSTFWASNNLNSSPLFHILTSTLSGASLERLFGVLPPCGYVST